MDLVSLVLLQLYHSLNNRPKQYTNQQAFSLFQSVIVLFGEYFFPRLSLIMFVIYFNFSSLFNMCSRMNEYVV